MKKLMLILSVALVALGSCEKEDAPLSSGGSSGGGGSSCNCGIVTDDPIVGGSTYKLQVRSDCSGNLKTFTVSRADWYDNHVGERTCITNSSGWRTSSTPINADSARIAKYGL